MKVAVVMPTRNQAGYICAAVASVLEQSPASPRLLVQDGASTDGTPALLATLAARQPQLHWVSEPDNGPADALNRAFRGALADPALQVFGWLNSDDLHAPGALQRVLQHFADHPDHVAVYGEGEHVDEAGHSLGRYPTRGPDTPLSDWADGCHVCQPTMWLRREALEALLPLDESLRTAFDLEFWLRLFKAYPGRIGKLDEVQAFSRLHDEGITLSQRRQVALESMAVVHRHIGPAPGHWLLTCANELMQQWPDGDPTPPMTRLAALLAQARPYLPPNEAMRLTQRWRGHRAVELGRADAWLDVEPDGWLLAHTSLRLRPSQRAQLLLTGRHTGASREALRLQACGPGGACHELWVRPGSVFTWRWPVEASPDETQNWRILADPTFIPAQHEPKSDDGRALACQITGLQWQP